MEELRMQRKGTTENSFTFPSGPSSGGRSRNETQISVNTDEIAMNWPEMGSDLHQSREKGKIAQTSEAKLSLPALSELARLDCVGHLNEVGIDHDLEYSCGQGCQPANQLDPGATQHKRNYPLR